MTTSRITVFDAHPEVVFESLLGVGEEMGARIVMLDRTRLQVVFTEEGKTFRVSASTTDNGLGKTNLHMSWSPRGSAAASRCAKKVTKRTLRSVDQKAVPSGGASLE